jgi:uncharacterized protein DUF4331
MTHHYSGANFGFPRGDARLDLTDLFAFPNPKDASKSILISNVHPSFGFSPQGPTTSEPFAPETLYEIRVDTNGDVITLQSSKSSHFFTKIMDKLPTGQDAAILKNLLASRAELAAHVLSEKIGLSPIDTRRKELAEEYLRIRYSSMLESYGLRQIELLIATRGGKTLSIGQELLKRQEVAYVARTIGEFTIDMKAEVFVKSGAELVNLIEEVKAMDGVKDLIWSEVIEIVGRKNQIPNETLEALKKKEAIQPLTSGQTT